MLNEEIELRLKQLTEELTPELISSWIAEIIKWNNRVMIYYNQLKKQEDFDNIISQKSQNVLEKIQMIYKKRRAAKDLITTSSILTDGYVLLNEIGEKIRGTSITYKIITTTQGSAVSQIKSGEQVYEWDVPLEAFLKVTNAIEKSRLVLRSTTTVHKMLVAELNKEKNPLTIQGVSWDSSKIKEYSQFVDEIRHNTNYARWAKVNEGNLLEAFLRKEQYNISIYEAMENTMKKPDAFFQGGDIDDVQIKGLKASITNLNTLIQNMDRVLAILQSTQIDAQVLKQYMKKNAVEEHINENLDNTIDQVVNELLQLFTSNVQR